jgi:hypothetical protein
MLNQSSYLHAWSASTFRLDAHIRPFTDNFRFKSLATWHIIYDGHHHHHQVLKDLGHLMTALDSCCSSVFTLAVLIPSSSWSVICQRGRILHVCPRIWLMQTHSLTTWNVAGCFVRLGVIPSSPQPHTYFSNNHHNTVLLNRPRMSKYAFIIRFSTYTLYAISPMRTWPTHLILLDLVTLVTLGASHSSRGV